MKIKVGSINTVYEYGLLGEEPNGNVYVSGSSGEDIVKCLYEGNDIRCVLNLGSLNIALHWKQAISQS